uniref:Uncharacterized protein n=1 Tax=Onchocerca volvulus TaxID=6282 RepID=A0A8R1TVE2_ONCVO
MHRFWMLISERFWSRKGARNMKARGREKEQESSAPISSRTVSAFGNVVVPVVEMSSSSWAWERFVL